MVSTDSLRTELSGSITLPEDADYDAARRMWNADIDRRPALIVHCESAADVSRTVGFARENGLDIAIRSGAHSFGGASTLDDGVVIDLRRINDVAVDADRKIARVGGGALLADVDAATQAHGLAMPSGLVSHTGVAGLTLGGGMGWLTPRAGLTIDAMTSARVVTADGRILRASAAENPDLFWGIRGGGSNFGIVTEFEFALVEVGPTVSFALLFWDLDQGTAFFELAREVLPTLPPEVNILVGALDAPPEPFVPDEFRLRPGYVMNIVGFGTPEQFDHTVARIRDALPPLFEFVTPMPYVELQRMLDEANAWGRYCYDKGLYLDEFTDEVVAVVTDHVRRKNSPLSLVLFYRLGDGYARVGEDDTAFSGERTRRYACFMIAVCPVPDLLPADRAWVNNFWTELVAHSPDVGSYVNSMSEYEADRVRVSYGPAKYERLARIKAKYDPDNIFHRNANILPGHGNSPFGQQT